MNALRKLFHQYWNSPGAMTAASVLARAGAMATPLPILYTFFDETLVAYWLLLITFQSIVGGLSGSLPTIAMQMLSYAEAGSRRLTGSIEDHSIGRSDGPNRALKARVNHALAQVFTFVALLWIIAAGTIGTAVVWGNIQQLSSESDGIWMWVIFIALSAIRLKLQPLMAYLFAVGHTALARRTESWAWGLGAIITPLGLWLTHDPIIGLLCLYAPLLLQNILIRRAAISEGLEFDVEGTEEYRPYRIVGLIWERAWRGTVGTLLGMLTIYGSGFILAQYSEPGPLAGYLLAVNLIGIIQQIAISPLYGAMPSMAVCYVRGDLSMLHARADHVIRRSVWVMTVLMLPVPVVFVLVNNLGIRVAFVTPLVWAALCVSIFIVRYGAIHLHLFTVTNEIRLHIANGLFAVFCLLPLVILNEPPLLAYPIIQGCAAILYSVYARRQTFKALAYPLSRDVYLAFLPTVILLLGLSLQIFYL